MSFKESLQESCEPEVDVFTEHCFKRYKLRERHPNAFLKLKPSRFGPALPRRRIFIAPPMGGMSLPRATPLVPKPFDQKQETFAVKEQLKEVAKIPTVEDGDRELGAWIEERKKLQNLLDKCAEVESWLVRKESSSEQEAKVLSKIRESRELKKVQMKSQLAAASSSSIEVSAAVITSITRIALPALIQPTILSAGFGMVQAKSREAGSFITILGTSMRLEEQI